MDAIWSIDCDRILSHRSWYRVFLTVRVDYLACPKVRR